MKKSGVRVWVIGVGAEVHVCKELAKESGGEYHVLLDDLHLKHLLSLQLPPPPHTPLSTTALVKMGFPHHAPSDTKTTSLALCVW